jgi:hypothetical protein
MSISVARQLVHDLAMTHLAIPQRTHRISIALGLALVRVAVAGGAFHLAALLGEASPWPAGLAVCAVARLALLVALTRAIWRLGAFCLPPLPVPRGLGARTEILGEDSPI